MPSHEGSALTKAPKNCVPVLGGHHGAGAVVRRQNERGGGQRGGARHWAPASASTTLATAEKSSRPYPAALAAVSSWRAAAVVGTETPQPTA